MNVVVQNTNPINSGKVTQRAKCPRRSTRDMDLQYRH